MSDKRIFKRTEIDPNRRPGWVADLNDPESRTVNPDCYWYFRSRKRATEFLRLVDQGMDAHTAKYEVERTVAGTAPDTSLYLGAKRRRWLVDQGGIQPTIHQMVDEAMAGEGSDGSNVQTQ
jgi:hypothetical protein